MLLRMMVFSLACCLPLVAAKPPLKVSLNPTFINNYADIYAKPKRTKVLLKLEGLENNNSVKLSKDEDFDNDLVSINENKSYSIKNGKVTIPLKFSSNASDKLYFLRLSVYGDDTAAAAVYSIRLNLINNFVAKVSCAQVETCAKLNFPDIEALTVTYPNACIGGGNICE